MSLKDNITALFEPKTVAIIGASSVPGKVGYKVLANMAAPVRHLVLIVLAILGFSACSSGNYQDVLRTLLEKERLVEDTRVNLLLAAEAEKNAVLSSTEEAARTYADQCRSAMLRVSPSSPVEQKVQAMAQPTCVDRHWV